MSSKKIFLRLYRSDSNHSFQREFSQKSRHMDWPFNLNNLIIRQLFKNPDITSNQLTAMINQEIHLYFAIWNCQTSEICGSLYFLFVFFDD